MLTVTVMLNRKRLLLDLDVWNDETGNERYGNYQYRLKENGKPSTVAREGEVFGVPRGPDQKQLVQLLQSVFSSMLCNVSNPKPPKSRLLDGFPTFWKAYPRKVGKTAALKAFTKAREHVSLGTLLAAVEAHAKSYEWKRDGGKFIPYPATWLNRGQWDDELKPAGTSGSVVKPFLPQSDPAPPSKRDLFVAKTLTQLACKEITHEQAAQVLKDHGLIEMAEKILSDRLLAALRD